MLAKCPFRDSFCTTTKGRQPFLEISLTQMIKIKYQNNLKFGTNNIRGMF